MALAVTGMASAKAAFVEASAQFIEFGEAQGISMANFTAQVDNGAPETVAEALERYPFPG
ncbi:MAG: hypothetical protein JWM93_2656 [Frankiales bacterium]|nr:hypothetical protein [Frankiales bacterium]